MITMHRLRAKMVVGCLALTTACATLGGAPPKGSEDAPPEEAAAAMKAMGQKVTGTIVWSSSRLGNHRLFTMKTDGSDVKPITQGDNADWFPRFSPDGSKILFCRSKSGWVSERDANNSDKWDIFTVSPDGSDLVKVVENASWGTWVGPDEIIFVREHKILRTKLGSGKETEIMNSDGVSELDGALLQQPEMSHDGKYIAITLRGAKRETGIWDIEKKKWNTTGQGCQINWSPDGSGIYWVNPTGNGGSEVYHMPIKNGKPAKELSDDELLLMDMPGRRSHEYFPQLSADGKWLVWGITQRGHDHDTADYEIYLWEVGTPADKAVRLTYHSANDRWPDIFIPSAVAKAAPAPSAESPESAKSTEEATAASTEDTSGQPASSKTGGKAKPKKPQKKK